MASVSKRANGRWAVRWREHAGAPERSKQFARKADADQFRDRVAGDLVRGEYVDPAEGKRTIFGAFAESWIEGRPWAPSTRERQRSLYHNHVAPTFAAKPIGMIRPSELQAWATGLRLAPSSAGQAVQLVRSIFLAAVADRIIARSPAENIKSKRIDTSSIVPPTDEQVMALADAAMPELRAAVILTAATGLRQGELFGLTHDRVGWLRRELTIDRQLVTPDTGPVALGPTKSKHSNRTVPVADHALEVLAQHVEQFGQSATGFVFVNRAGKPFSRPNAVQAFRAMRARAAVPAKGWHDLRHYAASMFIEDGIGVAKVAATLGHTPAVCLKTYAHMFPNEDDRIRSAVSKRWGSSQRPADLSRTSEG